MQNLGTKLLAATAFVVASLSAANAQLACGNLNKTEFIGNFQGGGLNSTSFARLDASTVTFTVGGARKSCVLVEFSIVGAAVVFDPTFGNGASFQALLDETKTSAGHAAQMLQAPRNSQMGDNDVDAHSYQFIFVGVPAGQHTVAMQYRVSIAGNPPTTPPGGVFDQWIMTVRHR